VAIVSHMLKHYATSIGVSAKAGVGSLVDSCVRGNDCLFWIPAFAGMTGRHRNGGLWRSILDSCVRGGRLIKEFILDSRLRGNDNLSILDSRLRGNDN
jgi:hypothetical protein